MTAVAGELFTVFWNHEKRTLLAVLCIAFAILEPGALFGDLDLYFSLSAYSGV